MHINHFFNSYDGNLVGWHGGAVDRATASQQEGYWVESGLRTFLGGVSVLSVHTWGFSRYSGFLPQTKKHALISML